MHSSQFLCPTETLLKHPHMQPHRRTCIVGADISLFCLTDGFVRFLRSSALSSFSFFLPLLVLDLGVWDWSSAVVMLMEYVCGCETVNLLEMWDGVDLSGNRGYVLLFAGLWLPVELKVDGGKRAPRHLVYMYVY